MTNAEKFESGNPEPLFAGSFAIYMKDNGEALFVLRPLGEEEDQIITVPKMMVKMVMSGSGPFAALSGMMGK
jgi:hypothetical protein